MSQTLYKRPRIGFMGPGILILTDEELNG